MANIRNYFLLFFVTLSLIVFFSACGNDDDEPIIEPEIMPEPEIVLYDILGQIEKGPFLSGTSITINELNDSFNPTGRVFSTQINNNKGEFELKGLDLVSTSVNLTASGFYYDEVRDNNSIAQLTLSAISDITDLSSVNINILTTLERSRVEYLISQGSTFIEAKQRALNEVLSIFEIDNDALIPEGLSISRNGDGNAKLLAASLIVQGSLPVADLSQLINEVNQDIRTDGILDNGEIGTQLLANASILDLVQIRNNLEQKYESLGMNEAVIPPFETYITQFINNTDFEFDSGFVYPETGINGNNILFPLLTSTTLGDYSMRAVIPDGGVLKVVVSGNNWVMPSSQTATGWTPGELDRENYSRTFISNRVGDIDFKLIFIINGVEGPLHNKVNVEVYENNVSSPTFRKDILLTDVVPEVRYTSNGAFGQNLLDRFANAYRSGPNSLQAYVGGDLSVKIIIRGAYWSLDTTQTNTGWTFTSLDSTDHSRIFISESGLDEIDLGIMLIAPPAGSGPDNLIIEYYENGSEEQTFGKLVTIF